jgi:hypothetical protein
MGLLEAEGIIQEGQGRLGYSSDVPMIMDLSDVDNRIRRNLLSGVYSDAVLHAVIRQNEGAPEDLCGFSWRGVG